MSESYVQVATDGDGKKIRNLQLDVPQADGSVATVMLQVVNVRDENGDPIRTSDGEILTAIYQEIRALREMYGRATGQSIIGLPARVDSSPDFA